MGIDRSVLKLGDLSAARSNESELGNWRRPLEVVSNKQWHMGKANKTKTKEKSILIGGDCFHLTLQYGILLLLF